MAARILVVILLSAPIASAGPPGETAPRIEKKKRLLDAYLITAGSFTAGAATAALGSDSSDGRLRAASGCLGITTMMLAPSVGHWYVDDWFTIGLGMRLGSGVAVTALAINDPHLEHMGTIFGLVGAVALWETGTIWDLVTLPRAVRRYNHAHQVMLAPLVTSRGATGLSVGATF
jgi:hypothetical protein